MIAFDRSVITDRGRELMNLGTVLNFTRIGTGDGDYSAYENIAARTALKSAKVSYTPSSATTDEDGSDVNVLIANYDPVTEQAVVTSTFTVKEVGLFVTVNGTEELFALSVSYAGERMPAFNGANRSEMVCTWHISISGNAEVAVTAAGAAALAADLAAHEAKKVASADGVHGLKYQDETLSAYNSATQQWEEIKTGGGGSTIAITAGSDALVGQNIVISDGTDSVTQVMPANKKCVFEGVTMTGTLLASCDLVSILAETSIEVPYYGNYEARLNIGETFTLLIDTTESSLRGKTVTVTGTNYTKTGTMPASGALNIKTTYEGELTITATDGTSTATKKVTTVQGTSSYSVVLAFTLGIWGVEWTPGASSAMTRTDDAEEYVDPVPYVSGATSYSSPFDDVAPWKDMKKVTDAEGGTLVEIPKFWYKWSFGTKMKLQISDHEETGYSVAPAFMDRGDGTGERDKVYVGRYHCAASTYKSTTGVAPQASATRASFRSSISALGSKIWQWDYAMLITIQMLYLVEYADWDSQKKIGYGCGNNSGTQAMGYTDSMPYHTGTTQASRTTYGLGTQYRYIEGLWDNVYDWCDGIYFSNTDVYITKNPASFSDTSGGTLVGSRPGSGGWTSNYKKMTVSGFDWVAYPSDVAGAEGSYICDYCYFNASGVVLYVGGYYGQNQDRGLFSLNGHYAATNQYAYIGSRLQKLP